MPRLLVNDSWYDPLQPNAVIDTAYEDMLLRRSDQLFPGFVSVQFRHRISNAAGHAYPQLVLVDSAYRSWWLVLLETGPAPSSDYIRQQLDILQSARYGLDIADLLIGRNPALDRDSIRALIVRESPGLFALLGHPPAPKVSHPAIRVGIAEIFRSTGGDDILRINGQHPQPPPARIGTCTRDGHVAPNLLRLIVEDYSGFSPPPERCEIEISGALSMWTIRSNTKDIYLIPEGSAALPVGQDVFILARGANGRLRLELPSA